MEIKVKITKQIKDDVRKLSSLYNSYCSHFNIYRSRYYIIYNAINETIEVIKYENTLLNKITTPFIYILSLIWEGLEEYKNNLSIITSAWKERKCTIDYIILKELEKGKERNQKQINNNNEEYLKDLKIYEEKIEAFKRIKEILLKNK